MPVGDKLWQAQEDARKAEEARRIAEGNRTAANTVATIARINQEAQQRLADDEAARGREVEQRQAAAPTAATVVTAQPVREHSKGSGFIGFLILIAVVVAFLHAVGKSKSAASDPEPPARMVTSLPPATPLPGPPVSAPPENTASTPDSTATASTDQPLTEITLPEDMPFFMTRPVTRGDLEGKSAREIFMMEWEIEARYGKDFSSLPEIQAYFNAQPWYRSEGLSWSQIRASVSPIQLRNHDFLDREGEARVQP